MKMYPIIRVQLFNGKPRNVVLVNNKEAVYYADGYYYLVKHGTEIGKVRAGL